MPCLSLDLTLQAYMSPAICTLDPWEELTGEQQDRVLQQFSDQIAT